MARAASRPLGAALTPPLYPPILTPTTAHRYTPPEQWRPNARLPEREAPRPQYVAGEYATACALADAEAAVAAELETVAA